MKSIKVVKETFLYDKIKLVETKDIKTLKQNIKEIAKENALNIDEILNFV